MNRRVKLQLDGIELFFSPLTIKEARQLADKLAVLRKEQADTPSDTFVEKVDAIWNDTVAGALNKQKAGDQQDWTPERLQDELDRGTVDALTSAVMKESGMRVLPGEGAAA